MIAGTLSRRYARALFQLAVEEHREEEVDQEIQRFLGAYASSDLERVLSNPGIAIKSRKNVLLEVSKALGLSSLVVYFFCLLLERDRLRFLSSIAERYRRLLDQAKGRVRVRVVAPEGLEESLLEKLRTVIEQASGREVILKEETDPGLIGGLVVELEGKVYDGSVRTQLERMRGRVERGY